MIMRNRCGRLAPDYSGLTYNDYGCDAVVSEVPGVRSKCTVTVIMPGGREPTERIEYGHTFSEEQAETYQAPSEYNGQIFDYWEIVNTVTGEHIANCYSERFTFAVWNNYTITPHYTDDPLDVSEEDPYITVDYIDTSRNQWGDESFSDDVSDRTGVADKLIADFDLSFNDCGRKILESADEFGNYQYKLGMMFEVVGTPEDGRFDSDDYAAGEAGMTSRVTSLINANTSANGSAKIGGVNTYYSKIGISPDTVSNFNRSRFARSFNTSALQNKVLRLYAYMQTPEGDIILSAPKYITMYDYAKANLAVDMGVYQKRSSN